MAFDPRNPSLRDAKHRKGEFRETARNIVMKDRASKKSGQSVDTGGAIARAMEMAYQLGLDHMGAAAPAISASGISTIPWNTIPQRARTIFERIVLFNWTVLLTPPSSYEQGQSDRWTCYWDFGERKPKGERFAFATSFSRSTLAPIVRLGLMQEKEVSGRTLLVCTPLASETWTAALAAGQVRETGGTAALHTSFAQPD